MGRKESLNEREKVFPVLKGNAPPAVKCIGEVMKNKYGSIIMLMLLVFMAAAPFSEAMEAESKAFSGLPTEQDPDRGKDRQTDGHRLLEQLQKDLQSVEKATEGTRKLIEQSMHRPYLPDLYLRLAELYIEKSRILYHLKRAEDPNASQSIIALEANLYKTKAIDLYNKILKEFPDYEYQDKVLFFKAHEFRELGQFEKMLKCYVDIVETYPDSGYCLESYLLIGDYYFDSMNLEKAMESYQIILKAPESYVHGMARYKMAWCHINRNEYKDALALLEKLVLDIRYDEEKTNIDAYKKINLRREALMDLAYCYTEVMPPEGALEYFAEMSDSKTIFTAALDKLGHRYFLQENWAAAAMVYRKILSLSRNVEKNAAYAEKLFVCAQKAERMDRPEENVRMLLKTFEELESSWRIGDKEKEELKKQFELYARDLATRLHVQAKEKEDKVLYSRASDAYAYYLDFFKEGAATDDLLHNQAETLYLAGRYFEAAGVYERVNDLYNAVASYYKSLKEEKTLDDLQKIEAREGLRFTGNQYLAMYPQAIEAAEVGFNVAWVSYEQGDYGAALKGFRDFIKSYPRSKEALAAGHLILDINKNLDNIEGLIADARGILDNTEIIDGAFRKNVEAILMAAEQRHLEELTVKVKDGVEGSDTALLALGESAKDVKLQEMALYNIFVVNKDAGKIPDIIKIGRQILERFPQTAHREDLLATLAHFYLKAADFSNAAAYSEKAAKIAKGEKRIEYITRAARLQSWMGETAAAAGNYQKALPLVPPKKQWEIKKDLLEAFEKSGDWAGVIGSCRELMVHEPQELQYVFRYAVALKKLKKHSESLSAFKKVCDLYAKKALTLPDQIGAEEKAWAAQARFALAEQDMRRYKKISFKGKKIDNALIERKLKGLQAVETACLEVAQYASPRWTIAALEQAAEANQGLCRFFLEAPLPKGLSDEQKAQYQALLEQKVQPFRDKARQYREAVLKKAYTLGIFCPEVKICYQALNKGASLPEISRGVLHRGGGEGVPVQAVSSLHEALYADPENPALLRSLAGMYAEEGKMELAVLILYRCLEKNEKDMRAQNLLGVIRLVQGQDQEAAQCFLKALELGQGQDEARANLVILYEGYGNASEAQAMLVQIHDKQAMEALKVWAVHPDFSKAVDRLEALLGPGAPLKVSQKIDMERR